MCVCFFVLWQNKKTSQLNRFVLSSVDGHDAKTQRVHQCVVANDLSLAVLFLFSTNLLFTVRYCALANVHTDERHSSLFRFEKIE